MQDRSHPHRFSTRVRSFVALTAASVAMLGIPAPVSAASANPFGIMFGGDNDSTVQLATDLGVGYVRKVVPVSLGNGSCPSCEPYRSAGMGIVLTARNTDKASTPSTPPADLGTYASDIARILTNSAPDVLVVENEESAPVFYSGTPSDYAAQLTVACSEARARSIPCTNGGIPDQMLVVMTYVDHVNAGRQNEALSYARRATMNDKEYYALTNSANLSRLRSAAARGQAFMSGYASAGADYVNFHWYRPDASAMAESIEFIERSTGLPAMSNEIGQFTEDPAQITAIMDQVIASGLDYALWFSLDFNMPNGYTTRALQNPDHSLRPHGRAFDSYLEAL